MPKKNDHDLRKYPYVLMGTLSLSRGSVLRIHKNTHNDIESSTEVKMIIVVDKWLHSLSCI